MNSNYPVYGYRLFQHTPSDNSLEIYSAAPSGYTDSYQVVAWHAPFAQNRFSRKQERNRHLLKHVPYFIHCPLPHCAWRGNRAGLFKKHWQQEDHRAYHKQYSHSPRGSQIETYDPWAILGQIINGTISPREGEDQAIFLVQMKAFELQKLNMWMDPGGRKKRRSMRRA
ncbi:hypothetical protein EDB86DRAFT_2918721 [Lactarius hatsudake]|nr:hypothetical protein EDB86DRAFT_2918721 [Lactarius hatsudake]